MGFYVIVEAFVGIVGGILLAACTKKAEGVTYGNLDKAGRIVNIAMLLAYLCVSPLYLFIGFLSAPAHDGFLGVLGWIVSIICASVTMFCGLGLGASVALRKKGKSLLSFMIQFSGVIAFGIMFVLFALFYGNLLDTLN